MVYSAKGFTKANYQKIIKWNFNRQCIIHSIFSAVLLSVFWAQYEETHHYGQGLLFTVSLLALACLIAFFQSLWFYASLRYEINFLKRHKIVKVSVNAPAFRLYPFIKDKIILHADNGEYIESVLFNKIQVNNDTKTTFSCLDRCIYIAKKNAPKNLCRKSREKSKVA